MLWGLSAQSQVKSIISHYSTSDGLPDNRIRSIIKDNEGYIWIGSWAGISRFDGHNFVNFKSYPGDNSSLRSNRVYEIVDDKAGFIWLRAYDSQIYRFDKRSEEFLAISDLLNVKGTEAILFSKILQVGDEGVWLKSVDQGLFLIKNSASQTPSVVRFAKGLKHGFQLPSNDILFFHLDKSKNAWLGTSRGLVRVARQADKSYRAVADNRFKGLVYTHADESGNDLWFTTSSGYLLDYKKNSNTLRKYKVSKAALNNVHISARSNKIYCTTATGAVISIAADGSKLAATQINKGEPLFSIYEDRSGLLWIEPAIIGVYKLEPKSGRYRYFTQKNLSNYLHIPEDYKVFEDKEGTVWTYMKGCGFGYYDRKKDEVEYFYNEPRNPYSRFSNSVTALYYDPTGVLWLSTDARGLEKIVFQRSDFKQSILRNSSFNRSSNEVRSVLADRKNRLWIGTKSGGIFVIDNGKVLNDLFDSKPETGQGAYCIVEDRKGRIWLGTKDNGLYKAEPLNEEKSRYKLSHFVKSDSNPRSLNTTMVYTVLEDSKGRIWAGSYGDGLILIDERGGKTEFITTQTSFKNYPKGNYNKVRHIAEDASGKIWVATTEGLIVFDPDLGSPDTYKFVVHKKEPGNINSLGGDDVQYIYRDSRNRMWVCTASGGLNRAIVHGASGRITFENYSTKNGLPSDYVLSCIEDNSGNFWLATQNGLSKFIVAEKKFQNFGLYDGLSDVAFSEGSVTRLRSGELVFGSLEGYWSFDPKKIGTQKISVNLALTAFKVNNVDVVPGKFLPPNPGTNNGSEVELKHDENTISIDFAVLDYRLQNKDTYVYRLKGFEEAWQVNNGQRRATYTNLPPGKYVFEVRSQTEYLYSEIPQKSLAISILPPPWKTWWAYLFYICVAGAVLLIAKRVALTMLRLRQGIAIERRLADLKLNFFTQVSHELRTPLTLIVNPAEEILQSERLSVKGTEYINVVIKNARRMVRLVNQVLDLRKAQSGKALLKISQIDVVSFTKGVIEYFEESLTTRKISVSVRSNLPELLLWVDVEKLDIVIYNLLANAIKFSPDNGNIQINITEELSDNTLRLEVVDEGIGVPEDELDKIFELYYEGLNGPSKPTKGTGIGLALSKELVELHNGKIYAKSNSPQGLSVVVELLPGKEHFNPANSHFATLSPLREKERNLVNQSIEVFQPPLDSNVTGRPSVLLVEDNDELRTFLANKLLDHYNVHTAKDGEEGLHKAKELLPDLVLSDIMMPKVDGIQMLDALKNDISTSHIPVVLLTAKFSVQSQIEALRYGADYYISKPFQMDLLQTVIQSLISQRKKLFQSLLAGKNISEISSPDIVITSHDQQFLERIIKIVDERLGDSDFNIDDVAESVGMSRSAFFKKFKSLTNSAPVEFVRETRLNRARKLFDLGEKNVSTVAYSVGFNDPKYFSTCFKAKFHQKPTEYIKELNGAIAKIN